MAIGERCRCGLPGTGAGSGAGVTNLVSSSGAVRRAYREELGPGQRSALLSWLAFTATFAGLRALTYSIRVGKGPFGNISAGGEHLHHYLWGIGLLSGVGAVAVRGEERHRRHPAVAVCYGLDKLRRDPAIVALINAAAPSAGDELSGEAAVP